MSRFLLLIMTIVIASSLPSCSRREQTPPKVSLAYAKLLSSLDPKAPGASFDKLQWFARNHSQYTIASVVEKELKARVQLFVGDAFKKCDVDVNNPTKEGLRNAMELCKINT
ncbi:MAG: hypothetical protein M0036_20605, partial [Desulfobacteraceae bacterium]|nr:hypothetical protein [Desulfobacteraceae bacterium]